MVADVTEPRSGALAVTVGNDTTNAEVMSDATLNVVGNLFVQADTTMARRNLAQTVSGGEGQLGIAVAVDVINSNTNAYLDGTANVGGVVNVTATETTNTDTGFKELLFPALLIGVNASAGVGTNSSGSAFDDLQDKSLEKLGKFIHWDKFTDWVKQKAYGATNNPAAPTRPEWQGAGALTVVVDTINTTARIGDGSTLDTATVEGTGGVYVTSTINSQPALVPPPRSAALQQQP